MRFFLTTKQMYSIMQYTVLKDEFGRYDQGVRSKDLNMDALNLKGGLWN